MSTLLTYNWVNLTLKFSPKSRSNKWKYGKLSKKNGPIANTILHDDIINNEFREIHEHCTPVRSSF